MNLARKTERKYGIVVAAIREVAARGKEFTRQDIAHSQVSVAYMLDQLFKHGELRRVRKGIVGVGGCPPVYKKP